MSKLLIQRGLSLALSALLTVAMLGGIDHLSQREAPAPLWAQQTAARA